MELETDKGNLLVYGTIIEVLGNRYLSFEENLKKQVDDYKRLSSGESGFCICGDFNCSFADNYYFTKAGRNIILQFFSENNIELLTANRPLCIDHIAISEQFVLGCDIHIEEWNTEKTLSDHKGIAVEFV